MLRNSYLQCQYRFLPRKVSTTKFKRNGLDVRTLTSNFYNNSRDLGLIPSQSQIVIAGAGAVANSVAYHLGLNGWKDVLVLEQNFIGSGSSTFGSGILGLFKPIAHRDLISYSIELYKHLDKMGYDIEMKQCGSVNLAQTKDRIISIRRRMAYNVPTGLHCEMLSRDELRRLYPHLNVEDIEGGVWVPDDATVNPQKVCQVLASLAKNRGAKYIENCRIESVTTANGRVSSVRTSQGSVSCEYFVNCAGMWARELGLTCSPPVRIPVYPAQHFYALTNELPVNLHTDLPVVRDYDSHSYMRQWHDGLMAGWFEPEAKPAFEYMATIPSKDWSKYLNICPEHWRPLWTKIVHRFPGLRQLSQPVIHNSPDNFTPDGRWILGESPEVKNYFVAVGMNGNSLQGAGGIGKVIAEWLTNGESTQELLPFNISRFISLHNNRQYLQQRIREVVGRNYSILYPHQCEYKYARKLRCSPLYSVLEARGAIFGIKMAYERPLYFDPTYRRADKKPVMPPGSFFKPKFFDFMMEEYQACREAVGIIDMSSFSKIEIKSKQKEVVDYLQRLCSTNANISVGSITRTGMLNERGGYENDCMLIRQSEKSYFMISPTSQQTRIYQWLSRHLPADHSVRLNDVTSSYTVLNVVGPKAQGLLCELSNSDVRMPPFVYKMINIAYASDVMIMSFTHTGETGYCLYIPSEYAIHVYLRLMQMGYDYGVRDVGVLTQRFMRIERFIPFWGEELTPFVTPFEAGCSYSVNLNKPNFIGKRALQRQKDEGISKRLVLFVLEGLDENKDVWAWGGEPIYRNNEFVGRISSAGYGFSVDRLIGLGFISRPDAERLKNNRKNVTVDFITDPTAVYEVDIAGKRFLVKPHVHAIPLPAVDSDLYMPKPANAG